MAVSKINTEDYYKAGDTVNVSGIYYGLVGNAKTVGFTIPTHKHIPPNATYTFLGLSTGWMRTTSGGVPSFTYKEISVLGDTFQVVYNVPDLSALTIAVAYINGGTITFN